MKLVIFTTCKPFINDDYWRQEQAIKSWTLLEGIEKEILIMGNDEGVKEICDKYNLKHISEVKCFNGIPYVDSMFEIAASYANDNDILMWTNSDIIFFNDLIQNIFYFSNKFTEKNIKNYLLTGQRHDWTNPKVLNDFSKENFIKNSHINSRVNEDIYKLDSQKHEIGLHPTCGIDYIIHSKTTINSFLKKGLVIAGTTHDMILLGIGIINNIFTCDITNTNFIIHQNHEYKYTDLKILETLKNNNLKINGIKKSINECPYITFFNNNNIHLKKK
jgi:hypothetical protein